MADRKRLEELDLLRFDEPESVIAELKAASAVVPEDLGSLYLGVLGSSYRVVLELPRAAGCLRGGLVLARKQRDEAAEADLLRRLSYVDQDAGENLRALRHADLSAAIGRRRFDLQAEGKGLAAVGRSLFCLGREKEAIEVNELALKRIPDDLPRSRVQALQGNGLCYLTLGDLNTAIRYARMADEYAHSLGPDLRTRHEWFLGSLYSSAGDVGAATRLLERTVEHFRDRHYGDLMLASLDLMEVYLRHEMFERARALSLSLRPVMFCVDNQTIQSAILELRSKSISAELLNRVRCTIENIRRERLEWRPLRVSHP